MAVASSHPPTLYPAAISPVVTRATKLLAYHSRLAQHLDDAQLSPILWPALLLLCSRDSASLPEIARALTMQEFSALRWVKSLEESGMVAERYSINSSYVLTKAGRTAVEAMLEQLEQM